MSSLDEFTHASFGLRGMLGMEMDLFAVFYPA